MFLQSENVYIDLCCWPIVYFGQECVALFAIRCGGGVGSRGKTDKVCFWITQRVELMSFGFERIYSVFHAGSLPYVVHVLPFLVTCARCVQTTCRCCLVYSLLLFQSCTAHDPREIPQNVHPGYVCMRRRGGDALVRQECLAPFLGVPETAPRGMISNKRRLGCGSGGFSCFVFGSSPRESRFPCRSGLVVSTATMVAELWMGGPGISCMVGFLCLKMNLAARKGVSGIIFRNIMPFACKRGAGGTQAHLSLALS